MPKEPNDTQSKRTTILRSLWILFQAGWGAALGIILFWGPLSLSGWPVIAAGLVGALVMGGLWLQADRLAFARGLRRGLHLFNMGILLAAGGAALNGMYTVGAFPRPATDRVENFERLWRAMDAAYPYFDQKGVDWDAVYEQNAPRVAAAGDDEEYRQIIGEILAGLNDLHTHTNGDSGRMACCFAISAEVENQAVVTKAGEQAMEAGLIPGSVIVSVDSQPAEKRVQAYMADFLSTSLNTRREAFFHLLALYEGDDRITVEFIDPQGRERTVELRLTEQEGQAAVPALDSSPLITARQLDSGIAVIRIPTFSGGSGHDLVAEFDLALDSVFDAPALILDLRANGGGSSMLADQMAGRLFTASFVYGVEYFPYRMPQRLWRAHFDYRVNPREPVYARAVAVITDSTVASSAENFLAALVDSSRGFTVGQRTAGGSGNPVHFNLPGGDCQFSTGDFRRLNGLSIEGMGFEPDLPVELTLADIVAQRDAFLIAAETALLEGLR